MKPVLWKSTIQTLHYPGIETEVKNQIQRPFRTAGYLNNAIWENIHIRMETKIYTIMINSADPRANTSKIQWILETTEMKILTSIIKHGQRLNKK